MLSRFKKDFFFCDLLSFYYEGVSGFFDISEDFGSVVSFVCDN